MQWQGRIAPTPSGYLHFGNAYNFILCWLETRSRGGELRLRIDDLDRERFKPEFLDDIFRQLDFIGLDWDHGPQNAQEQEQYFSQVLQLDSYHHALQHLEEQALLFPCACSRSEVQERNGANFYRGFCLRNPPNEPADTCLRFKAAADTPLALRTPHGKEFLTLDDEEAFPIVQRKDKLPAYQLASVVDDIRYGTNLIVRGQDLWQSSKVQVLIAKALPANHFGETCFIHHLQLDDEQGQKLSKSHESPSLSEQYAGKSNESLWRDFIRIAQLPDLEPKLEQVLAYWKNTR
ncbi:MAG: hypothetical protein EP332_04475 [Bacteroidetes bacterium]|nr:MAG: hypothetical protein EP332_04475 [Bacteroidota bacterium]